MKSKLMITVATLAALALPAMAAENNFRDRDRNNTGLICGVDTCMRHIDPDGFRFVERDKDRNHSLLVDKGVERLRHERFDRDRRDRDDVRR
jgi:hypothetical protein